MGIASIEDKIVQQAVVTVLSAIYEVDFLGFSYGFRPGLRVVVSHVPWCVSDTVQIMDWKALGMIESQPAASPRSVVDPLPFVIEQLRYYLAEKVNAPPSTIFRPSRRNPRR